VTDLQRLVMLWSSGNGRLRVRELRGELEPWEVCTCHDIGSWDMCPRTTAAVAAYGFARIQP